MANDSLSKAYQEARAARRQLMADLEQGMMQANNGATRGLKAITMNLKIHRRPPPPSFFLKIKECLEQISYETSSNW